MSPSSEPPLLNGHAHNAAESEPQKWDYSQPGSTGYSIPQNTTWRDPNNRKLRVLTIGAGISGILIAYQIQKQCSMVEHVVYEKNEDIGGTWLENRYPRAGCDIPSHAYTYQFALNPDWPRFFSYASEIQDYLNKVCDVFGLRKYMNFHTRVVGCFWMEEEGEWLVKLRHEAPGEEPREFEDRCHLLLHGAGILNNWKWPNVAGLHDRFQGKVIHTANWPESYQKEEWANETVAVLGSGASSVQTVPGMQPFAKKLEVFVRTGIWFGILAGNFGHNKQYEPAEREEFHKDPMALVKHAKDIEGQVNGLWGGFYSGTKAQAMATGFFRKRMAEKIKDERLLKGLTPQFGLGCRRITPGDPYIEAIQQQNVDVHFTAVEHCTEDGVVGEDGVEHKVDTIVCATGFDVSYRPSFPIVGKNGSDLAKKWAKRPEGYLGVAVPDFPNFLTFMGPTWPIQNGSVMAPLHTVSEYAVQVIKKMQNENVKSLTPKQGVTDKFNEHAQEWIKHTVYKESCRAWYKDHDTGRVNAIWPGSSLHYQQVLDTPRYEDFDIEHFDDNPWACLGMGWTVQDRLGPKEADVCPYLSLDNIDPQWLEACGGDVEVWKHQLASSRGAADFHGGSATPALA